MRMAGTRMRLRLGLTVCSLLCAAGCSSVPRFNGREPTLIFSGLKWDSEDRYPFTRPPFTETEAGGIGFIDSSGKVMIQPLATAHPEDTPLFANGLAPLAAPGGEYGYIDKIGNFAIAPQFKEAGQFSEGFACARTREGDVVYVDPEGRLLPAPKLHKGGRFSEGFAPVWVAAPEGDYEERWGYIDRSGKLVIDARFTSAGDFSEGLAPVGIGKKHGYIDKTGKVRIELGYDMGDSFAEGLAVVIPDGASLGGNSKWAYLDASGKRVIERQLLDAERFHEGLASAGYRSGDDLQLGFLNRAGRMTIAPRFTAAGPFSSGLAAVREKSKKLGYIDKSGSYVIPPQFEHASPFFPAGIAFVESHGRTQYINRTGNCIWNCAQ